MDKLKMVLESGKSAPSDLLAFVAVQMREQIYRITSDPSFNKLTDDSKLAMGGISSEVKMLEDLLYYLKIKESQGVKL